MRLQQLFTRTASCALPLTLAAAPFAGAQQATPSPLALDAQVDAGQFVPTLSGLMYSQSQDGTLYAQGDTWKAEFGAQGAVYIPFLGSDAPRNFPVKFRLASATVGGQALELAARPTIRRDGARVVIDHGSIQEVYDLTVDSVEQSFVVPSRANSGEVVVRMDVDTDLVGAAAGQGLRFAGQHGGVDYGAAFAFDATGRTADVQSTLSGDVLELRVPATFPVANATAFGTESSLTIDPVMTSFHVGGATGQAMQDADIAFEKDVDGGVYLVVWERQFSANDHDVYSAEVLRTTGEVRNEVAIDMSQDDYRAPRVAGNDAINAFMIVSEVFPQGNGGLSDIIAHVRNAGSSLVSPPRFVNDAPGASECFTPDIGGESLSIPGIWCVVYTQDLGAGPIIRAQSMNIMGSRVGFARVLSTGTANTEPTVSESSGDDASDRRFNVAWTRRVSTFNTDIEACQVAPVSSGLSIVTPRFSLGGIGSHRTPAVSSLASTPLIATGERPWIVASTQASSTDDLIAQVVSGSQIHTTKNITAMEGDEFTGDYRHPAVACTGNAFVLTYQSLDISGREQIFMTTAYVPETATGATLALAERRQAAATNNNGEPLAPQMVSDWESGLHASDEGLLAFTYDYSGIGGRHIRASKFEAYSSPAIGSQYCSANRNSTLKKGWLAAYGGNNAGNNHVLLGTDLPVGQFGFLICSKTAGSVNHPGGSEGRLCLGGSIGRMTGTLTSVLSSGTALFLVDSSDLATPGGMVAAQVGETWHYQAWHRDVIGGLNTSNYTNAVRVMYK